MGILIFVMGGVLSSFVHALRIFQQQQVVNELTHDLEIAMESIHRDLRLSSVGTGLMSFYPENGSAYTAISLPLSEPPAVTNALLERDSVTGKIIWNRTIVYHVREGTPDKLLRTVFAPRDTNSVSADFYDQLVKVEAALNDADLDAACLPFESVISSRVVFENLVHLEFRSTTPRYDTYAPATRHGGTVNFGSVVLSNGWHNLEIEIVGQNPSASCPPFGIHLDRFSLSPSGNWWDGEMFTPVKSHPAGSDYFEHSASGMTVKAQNTLGPGWSGQAELVAESPATNPGTVLTLKFYNDMWCDNNFLGGQLYQDCYSRLDKSYTSQDPFIADQVLSMLPGKKLVWSAAGCSDYSYAGTLSDPAWDPTYFSYVRTYVRGVKAAGVDYSSQFVRGGRMARVRFLRGGGTNVTDSFLVTNAYIRNMSGGQPWGLKFAGESWVEMDSNDTFAVSDWVQGITVVTGVNYDVSYFTKCLSGKTNQPWFWHDPLMKNPPTARTIVREPAKVGTEVLPGYFQALPAPGCATYLTNIIIGVESIEVGNPTQAVFRSSVHDTVMEAPEYNEANWTMTRLNGWGLAVKVRSSSFRDMHDNPAWQSSAGFPPMALGSVQWRRYLQYEVVFTCAVANCLDPIPGAVLRDITIDWPGPTALSDFVGEFGKTTNGAVIQARVDGQDFVKAVTVDMVIYRSCRMSDLVGTGDPTMVRATLEVRPLNTGR